MEISFFVAGEPKPKGSTKSFPFRRANGSIGVSTTNANPKTKPWQDRIATEAQMAMKDKPFISNGPVTVYCEFDMPRPKYLDAKKYQGKDVPMTKRADVDKLLRSCLDALTGVVFADDSQVTILTGWKRYAEPGEGPGMKIVINYP